MAETSNEILKENLVLVEGHDEELFFDALLRYMGITSYSGLAYCREK